MDVRREDKFMEISNIPCFLLPHKAVVRTEKTHDAWGNVTFDETTVSKVRIAVNESSLQKKSDKIDLADAVLYFDMENSLPKGFEFSCGQLVCFLGKSFEISEIRTVLSASSVHHLEIGLSVRRSI